MKIGDVTDNKYGLIVHIVAHLYTSDTARVSSPDYQLTIVKHQIFTTILFVLSFAHYYDILAVIALGFGKLCSGPSVFFSSTRCKSRWASCVMVVLYFEQCR